MSVGSRLSSLARRAMGRASGDYVSKDVDELAVVRRLKSEHGLEHVYRFDIGKNTDGFSPLIHEVMDTPELVGLMAGSLTEYPENHYGNLRRQLARLHGLAEEEFELGAGLESVIDQIARAVLDPGDTVLVPIPNFDLFESASIKAGGELKLVSMGEEQPCWTEDTVAELERCMADGDIKLTWISNPVNPTGQHIPLEHIGRLVESARRSGGFIVVDEAYGEYTDDADGVVSATRFLHENPQLMVLRTFSKIHCLPSARVGYMMCSDPQPRQAVNTFRPMFPFSWISLYMAQLALLDDEHVEQTRAGIISRKARLMELLAAPDSGLDAFTFLDSDTNTLMFRHQRMQAAELGEALARRGFLVANLNGISGISGQQYLRMTLHEESANDLFLDACAEAAREFERVGKNG